MSEKQFENFLVENLKTWLKGKASAGERFQFRSIDPDNTLKLLSALHSLASGHIYDNEQKLSYLLIDDVKVIIAGHAEVGTVDQGCYSENYLAKLRDSVVDDSNSLVMVHNSSLDTITNSTLDLAQVGAIWSVESIKERLYSLIDDESDNHITSRCLLDIQSKMIASDNASIFGYRSLYESMIDGELRFDELGLFNDPVLTQNWQSSSENLNKNQVERRIEENKKLRAEIESEIEHYPAELEDRMTLFGSSFIKKNFIDSENWKELSFDQYSAEIDKQKKQNLEFDQFECEDCSLEYRSKKEAGSGLRDVHLLIQTPIGTNKFEFDIKFSGDTTQKQEFEIQPKKIVDSIELIHRPRSKKTTLTVIGQTSEQPIFFTISLKRQLSAENYKFHCVVLPKSAFYLDDVFNQFLVRTSKGGALILQAEQQTLKVSADVFEQHSLQDSGELIDVNTIGIVNFQQLYDESDEVRFTLKNGASQLQVIVEGESAKEPLILPLFMDVRRTKKLFHDDYFASYKSSKDSVILDNQETKQLFLRQQLLKAEWSVIDQEVIDWNGETQTGTTIVELEQHGLTDLYQHYSAFLKFFKEGKRKTLPSLEGWGPKAVLLGQNYIYAYLDYVESLPVDSNLDDTAKLVMRIGTAHLKDPLDGRIKQYFMPFHPLVLSYTLHLIESILMDGEDLSFKTLAPVTLKRLNARGLVPHLFDHSQGYSYTQVVDENPMWIEIVPREESSFDYITKLVKTKIEEFTSTFKQLFSTVPTAPILVNSVNNANNRELFEGILAYYMEYLEDARYIQVNLYDDDELETEFDIFAEMGSYDDIKERYGLEKGAAKRNTDTIVDVLRTRLSFSKYQHQNVTEQDYAHLTFFKNNQVVDARDNNIDKHISSVACGGLLNGESSRSENNNAYFTAFGLKGVDYDDKPHLKIARYFGLLWRPAHRSNDSYHERSAISLAVSDKVKTQLERSYDSSVWTTIIDPKVTLDFFQSSQDVILIHYSDQYTSSSGYDAITVTKQSQLYKNVLGAKGESLIREFNAFNGEWLLQMVNDEVTEKLGKKGVIASYKVVNAMLSQSDICWVPLSVAEMIRVAGNIGLAMSDSDFARHNSGIKKGAISDDILFAGFKGDSLYLLPVEAKAGSRPNYDKAREQALELKRYMEEMLGQQNLAGKLYRGLFVRQVLLQVEKYQLYKVFEDNYFNPFEEDRVVWLEGDYQIGQLANYPSGIVVAHNNSDSCLSERYEVKHTVLEHISGDVLEIDIPFFRMDNLVHSAYQELENKIVNENLLCVPEEYMLKPNMERELAKESIQTADAMDDIIGEKDTPHISASELKTEAIFNYEMDAIANDPLKITFGTDIATQTPVIWEPTNTEKLFNTNTGIIGTMGTGKTQFTKSVVTQLVRNQHKNVGGKPFGILIFDYKADYVKDDFVEATGAKVYDLFHLPFNPFAIFGSRPMQPMHTANLFRTTVSKAFSLGTKQQNKVRTLVTDAYEAAGIKAQDKTTWGKLAPTLADVWSVFQSQEKVEQDSLYAALDDLISFEIFEPDSSKTQSLYDLIDGVTVINLSGYDESIQNLVVALTLDLFYTQMHQHGSSVLDGEYRQISKMILVDEADNFMSQDFDSLKKILKEGREFGVGTILSTQELTHFKTGDNDYSTLILSWIIHQVANIKSQEIKAIFNTQNKQNEEGFMSEIRKLEKHCSLCVDGKKKVSKIKDLAFWELINN